MECSRQIHRALVLYDLIRNILGSPKPEGAQVYVSVSGEVINSGRMITERFEGMGTRGSVGDHHMNVGLQSKPL